MLLAGVEDVLFSVFDIELALEFITTIHGIVANSKLTQRVVAIAHVLKEIPIPESEVGKYVPRVTDNLPFHPKLRSLKADLDLIFWEVRTKLYAVKDVVVTSGLYHFIYFNVVNVGWFQYSIFFSML